MRSYLLQGNAAFIPLSDQSVHCVVTSPPYWGLRDYQSGDQVGLESTPTGYVENIVKIFREVWRVLRDDGTLWLNLGDSYNGSGGAGGDYSKGGLREGQPKYPGRNVASLKPKDLVGIPWEVAFALRRDGWYLRSDIIWHKPNAMPEPVRDRPSKTHEYIFLLTKKGPAYKWLHSQTNQLVCRNPKPDYYWEHESGLVSDIEPSSGPEQEGWTRRNYWQGLAYFYDSEAIREAASPQSLARINQKTFDQQTGGEKDYRGKDGMRQDRSMRRALENFRKNPGKNKRTVWTIPTKGYKGAHFAVYPPTLPEVCIKAGTSAYGVCSTCGAPWERVVKRIFTGTYNEQEAARQRERNVMSGGVDKVTLGRTEHVERKTEGWKPGCAHDAKPVPAIVLDPFGGSGTTAMVAKRLGRIGISLDLSWDYLQLARERTAGGHQVNLLQRL